MTHLYTPGLNVEENTVLFKSRLLPLPGTVLVDVGQSVDPATVIARTELPGKIHVLNIINQLSILPEDINDFMNKKQGDEVQRGEIIAEDKPFIRWLKTQVECPVEGSVENISDVTGQVLIREKPQPLDLLAYIKGTIHEILPNQGVVIKTTCNLVQGIFGVGGERWGSLVKITETPKEPLRCSHITSDMRGSIGFGGSYAGLDVLEKAKECGLHGLVVGGIDAQNLKKLLGYDLGVAITGTENIDFTLVITEGFGSIPMAQKTFDLLSKNVGIKASLSGATQIRAGVIRPEIIIPVSHDTNKSSRTLTVPKTSQESLTIGGSIRIIREPYFGKIGKISALPIEPRTLPTESITRVLEIELENGEHIIIPRANIETIGG